MLRILKSVCLLAAVTAAGLGCTVIQKPEPAGTVGERILFEAPVVALSTRSCAPATQGILRSDSPSVQTLSDGCCLSVRQPSQNSVSTRSSDPFTTDRHVLYGTVYPENWPFAVSAVNYEGSFAENGGWKESDAYFSDVPVSYTEMGENRGWAGNARWPGRGNLAIQAYSPVLNDALYSGASIGPGGVCFTDYSLSTDGSQPDLMYSGRVVDQSRQSYSSGGIYSGVQLVFHHALSTIVFTARTVDNYGETIFRITKIQLENVKTTGSFCQNLSAASTDGSSAQWVPSAAAEPGNYGNIVNESIRVTDARENLWENENVADLLVMPQDFGTAAVRICYTVQTSEHGGEISQESVIRLSDLSYTEDGQTDPTAGYHAFEPGRRYVYNIEIAPLMIRLYPIVSAWNGYIVM